MNRADVQDSKEGVDRRFHRFGHAVADAVLDERSSETCLHWNSEEMPLPDPPTAKASSYHGPTWKTARPIPTESLAA